MTTGVLPRESRKEEKAKIDKQFRKVLNKSIEMELQELKEHLAEIGKRINRLEEEEKVINQFFKA